MRTRIIYIKMVKTNVHNIDIHCTQVKYKFSYIKWTNGTKYGVHTIMSTHHIKIILTTSLQHAHCCRLVRRIITTMRKRKCGNKGAYGWLTELYTHSSCQTLILLSSQLFKSGYDGSVCMPSQCDRSGWSRMQAMQIMYGAAVNKIVYMYTVELS